MFDTVSRFSAEVRHPVVLLDAWGRAVGTAEKSSVHHLRTPFHQAFSCYVSRPDGAVLLTRRAATKRTWPGVWTNACCGHPRPGESLRQAITRHLGAELGVTPVRMALAIGDFAYRAEMPDGTVEHELCPVVVAEVCGELRPDPDEADALTWIAWGDLVERARRTPETLSPWSVSQIARLAAASPTLGHWLARHDPADVLLDTTGSTLRPRPGRTELVDDVRRRVDAHLGAFLDARSNDVPEATEAVEVLRAAIHALTDAGGKRLRPAFVLAGHVAAGGDGGDRILDGAAAVELLHSFALLHDDIMDRSATRRGRPAAQHAFRELHGSAGGDAAWFGISAAMLAGDLAFVWADLLFDGLDGRDIDPAHVRRARLLFTTLRTEVIAGQYLDLRIGADPCADEQAALRIALLKSARYTVTRPLQIGAALAGAGDAVSDRLAAYGDAVGLAFQLRDDVLGMFGSPGRTGKGCTDDLREGKRTVLMQRALELSTTAGRRTLECALGAADLDDLSAQRCRDIVSSSGALATVEKAIDVHLERALAHAATFDPRAGESLVELAQHAAQRDR